MVRILAVFGEGISSWILEFIVKALFERTAPFGRLHDNFAVLLLVQLTPLAAVISVSMIK